MLAETGYEMHLQRCEQRGREEEREEGKREQPCSIARAMLTRGMEPYTIAEITGLSVEEVAHAERGRTGLWLCPVSAIFRYNTRQYPHHNPATGEDEWIDRQRLNKQKG